MGKSCQKRFTISRGLATGVPVGAEVTRRIPIGPGPRRDSLRNREGAVAGVTPVSARDILSAMQARTRVKICGLTRAEDIRAAVAAGADAVGFVFVPGTPRAVSPVSAAELRRQVPPFVTVVGLFVNESPDRIRATVEAVGLDAVQLHGEETPAMAAACRQWTRVIKAFRVRGTESLSEMPAYAEAVDAYLLDAFVAGAHGGTGARFDWDLAVQARALGKPLILAGGLTPENAAEAVQRVRPYALDVSSGVEASPGIKDTERLGRFLAAVR